MQIRKTVRPVSVALPDGTRLSLADLPGPGTGRWVASRKRLVVLAVSYGLLPREEALARWDLSEEELEGWCAAYRRHGPRGLRATRRRIPDVRARGKNSTHD